MNQTTGLYATMTGGQAPGEIQPRADDDPHPFKGKVVRDIVPIGNNGWTIQFTDGSEFCV